MIATLVQALAKEPAIAWLFLQNHAAMSSAQAIVAARPRRMRSVNEPAIEAGPLRRIEPRRPARNRRGVRVWAVLLNSLIRAAEQIIAWGRRRRDRHLVADLNDRGLHDIGIDRAAAKTDTAMSFWRMG
jgi:uncharacterized protein YjiS (DUF1127 family)